MPPSAPKQQPADASAAVASTTAAAGEAEEPERGGLDVGDMGAGWGEDPDQFLAEYQQLCNAMMMSAEADEAGEDGEWRGDSERAGSDKEEEEDEEAAAAVVAPGVADEGTGGSSSRRQGSVFGKGALWRGASATAGIDESQGRVSGGDEGGGEEEAGRDEVEDTASSAQMLPLPSQLVADETVAGALKAALERDRAR